MRIPIITFSWELVGIFLIYICKTNLFFRYHCILHASHFTCFYFLIIFLKLFFNFYCILYSHIDFCYRIKYEYKSYKYSNAKTKVIADERRKFYFSTFNVYICMYTMWMHFKIQNKKSYNWFTIVWFIQKFFSQWKVLFNPLSSSNIKFCILLSTSKVSRT